MSEQQTETNDEIVEERRSSSSHCNDSTNREVTVTEDKFQATAIYTVEAETKERAKQMARKFFRDNYDHSVSRVIAEKDPHAHPLSEIDRYEVVVSDQSSGSLKGSETYNIDELTNES